LEQGFEHLDALLAEMEKEDISIEEAFSLFEKGTKLVASLHERLSTLEGRVEQIGKDGAFEEFADGE
ncbi:MAG: exodeoxyribonuclease VII small subunit, partial [Lachnospiraceae bacterium]|nr:exodeoxyribonuclease VII small subunit [Lachnospiraceae bacterium]